jgi:Cupin-like domain
MAKSQPNRKLTQQNSPAGNAQEGVDRFSVVEALINGTAHDTLIARLVTSGVSPASARFEVERAAKSPYFDVAARFASRVAKRDWVLENIAALGASEPDALVIPQIDRIDPAHFFGRYYAQNRPAKLTGLVDAWPALKNWSFDYFADLLGPVDIGVQWDRDADTDYEAQCSLHKAVMPAAEILARIKTGASNDFYVTANNNDVNWSALAPLWRDVGVIPGILEKQAPRDGYVWMGPQGTVTPWHHDLSNNLLMQFVGRKRVRLIAAHDTYRMRNTRHCFSDWSAEDLLPGSGDLSRPPVLECIIGPGEAVFIPVGWWHHVEALDATIGMSFLNFAAPNDFQTDYRCFGLI